MTTTKRVERGGRMSVMVLGAVLACVLPGCASGEHEEGGHKEHVALSSVPVAVQTAIKSAAGGKEIESITPEIEGGVRVYTVEIEQEGSERKVTFGESGAIVKEEMEVDGKALPAAVREAISKKYAGGKIKEAVEIKEGGKVYYEVDVKVGKEMRELKIDAAGTVLSDVEED